MEDSRHPFDLNEVIHLLRSYSVYPSVHPYGHYESDVNSGPAAWDLSPKTNNLNTLEVAEVGTTYDLKKLDDTCETTQIALLPCVLQNPLSLIAEGEEGPTPVVKIPEILMLDSVKIPNNRKRESRPSDRNKLQLRKRHILSFTPDFKRAELLGKIIENFHDVGPLLLPSRWNLKNIKSPPQIHVFVDHSNILIGFYEALKKYYGKKRNERIRLSTLSFNNLSMILERGRHSKRRILVGSTKSSPSVSEAAALGYETSILTRVEKYDGLSTDWAYSSSDNIGGQISESKARRAEQGVDEILHLKILESILDYPPSTIVLATGDGNVAEFSAGFFKAVERCLRYGWKLELFSFKRSLSKVWTLVKSPNFQIYLLDDYLLYLVDND